MDCSWGRTLASVCLLLSPHCVRVLGQNVAPTKPTGPPLPFIKEPLKDIAGFGPGPYQQQMNFMPPPPGGLPNFVPLCAPPVQGSNQFRFRPPTDTGSLGVLNTTALNIGPVPQAPVCKVESFENRIPLQDPDCYPPPNVDILQQSTTPQSPFSFPPPVISLPVPVLTQNYNPSPIVNIPSPRDLPLNIPSGPIPGSQFNIYPGLEVPIPISSGQTVIPASTLQNPQVFTTPYPQHCPGLALSNQLPYLPADLATVHVAPLNLPSAIPVQSYAPIPPSYQTVLPPSLVPMEYIPVAPVDLPSPNFQIAALPPVSPAEIPHCYAYNTWIPRPTGEFSQVPINLEINVPSPNMPEPKITVITAVTSPPSASTPVVPTDNSDISFGLFPPPPLPPIIIESRRSRSRSWLPLVLIALFARDGYDCGCGGCCPCNTDNTDIPIPFPIPIPTNNPIILGPGCSRSRGSRVKLEKKD